MKDKCVIVTGAFGALGQVVGRVLAERGAKVAAVDVAKTPPAGLSAALGDRVVLLGGYDLADPVSASKAVEASFQRLGRLDGLVNIAGGFAWETLAGGDPATWDRLYAMNVKTCANMCRAAVPHLEAVGGRVVNIGAGGAVKAAAGMGAYAAAKSGVHRLTEALAEELKGKVAVNAVLPSIIDTPANRRDLPDDDFSKWVAPQDLAEVIAFLASDAARAVTGALVAVTGRM
ncbi:MAG: SDR family NAD(P)-dependent oxidoreductase [Caulobacteraceae bacterium]|nr:SDR family NAD(P)-dependent oxidoreductase [Caulobacteraceae bacterium]